MSTTDSEITQEFEKNVNFGMDAKCANSCFNFIKIISPFVMAVTLVLMILMTFITTSIINFIEIDDFRLTIEHTMFVSIIVYCIWNTIFGLPMRTLVYNGNNVEFVYNNYAINYSLAMLIATILIYCKHVNAISYP